MFIPHIVHSNGTFAGLHRDDYPPLVAMITEDIKVSIKSLMRLFVREVRLKRQIGFTAQHSIQGENWKAWI